MELKKKSELIAGGVSYGVDTRLASDEPPIIETRVTSSDGAVVYSTSRDISSLKPIFQNSQKVFEQLESMHEAVSVELEAGRIPEGASPAPSTSASQAGGKGDPETDALEHAVQLLTRGNLDQATAALRAVLETYPNCVEARELLEIVYKASSDTRLPMELVPTLKRGTEAFTQGRQRDAIESWKQCLIEEPSNPALQTLVLLATTWSQTRRESFAQKVLGADPKLLGNARPEEAEALFLVAQSVYGNDGRPSPAPSPGDATTISPPPPPVPEAVATAPTPAAPTPPEPSPSIDTQPFTRDAAPPERKPAAQQTPEEAAPAQAASTGSGEPKPRARPANRPAPRRPAPVGRARRSTPWPTIAAIGGVVVLSVVIAGWLLSGGGTVPPGELERAATLVGSGQYSQAIAAYDGILQQFGENAEVYLGRGRARIASGETDEGLADLERALTIDPSTGDIAEEIGDVFYSQGNYPRAIEYYEKAFTGAAGAGGAEGRYRLAVSLVQQDRSEDALRHLNAAIQSDPSHGEAQFLLAQLSNEHGRHAEAERALRAAEPHVEGGSDFLAQLGMALLEQNKLDEAEESAREFIRSYPNDARARAILGEVYLNRQQYEAARAQLIQALRTDPREPRAQIALGRTWLAIGKSRNDAQDLSKARQVLESATGVHEGKRLLALGQVALAEGDPAAAEGLLTSSLAEGAPPLPVRLSLAEAKTLAEDLVGAAEELQQASALAADDPAIAMSLGVTYSRLREPGRAAEQFLKTLQTIGLVAPPGPDSGPVVLPVPVVPLPARFDVTRAIRNAYETTLQEMENDPTASELKALAENATFVVEG